MKTKCTCGVKIKEHGPGACLDALFCTEVMKWKLKKTTHRHRTWWDWSDGDRLVCESKDFNPSTNIEHAMEGVEKHKNELEYFELYYHKGMNVWTVATRADYMGPINSINAKKPELAITRALVLWAMEGEKDESM